MCDSADSPAAAGWRGWTTSDEVRPATAAGDWVDLSWPLSPSVPRLPSFPPPSIGRFKSMPADPFNATELSMVVHIGTHVDAPSHFVIDAPPIDEVPLSRLMGTGVVWKIDMPLEGLIEPDDLERMEPRLRPGDIVVLDTGLAHHAGTPDYDRHAALSVAAAEWLVAHGAKLLAVDMPTPELPLTARPDGFDWPVHHTLLRDGVLIAEQVTNTAELAGRRVELLFLPLNIAGGDGGPARVLGRPIED